ncbi:MAG: hypothetical protein ACLVGL_10100 [Waltera sp.]
MNSKNTNVEITNANNLVYTGNPLTAAVKVTYNGTELTEGQDYTVSSNTGTNARTYTLTITGQGNYGGSVEKVFTIAPTDKLTVEGYGRSRRRFTVRVSDIAISGLTVRSNNTVVDGSWKFTGREIPAAGTTTAYTAVLLLSSNYKQIKRQIKPNIRKAACLYAGRYPRQCEV